VCNIGISECIIENPTARGLGIVITNDYIGTQNSPLHGTCKDGYGLLELLVDSDFIVVWLHNVDRQAISDIMDEVKSLEEHENRESIQKYECILFAFSGHGLNNKYIVMQDTNTVNVETDILQPLLPSSIRKFGEIPKVLLIDACRGSLEAATVSTKLFLDVITKDTIPAEGNYLLACATMPGHVSYMIV
jgi:ribosomal protein L19